TVVIGIAVAAVVGWVVGWILAPVVDLARHGTRDERAVRSCRREGRAPRPETVADATVPDQRRPEEPASPALEGAPGSS
ncbi:MAG: hypothetical protein K0S40_4945, partial [Actinomycetospora sp.]|nr:hypothetical protein [Actinomycetospora sp.]